MSGLMTRMHRASTAELAADIANSRAVNLAAVEAARERSRVAREVEAARVKATAADLVGARYVRTRWGWFRVPHVNTTTVSVEDGVDTDRIPFRRILEIR